MTSDDAGVPDSDPAHIDPAGDMADFIEHAAESGDITIDTKHNIDELREFVDAAEAGELPADPGTEAAVRMARTVIEHAESDSGRDNRS